jgi:UDP-N-acetylmuramate--alanine ligase
LHLHPSVLAITNIELDHTDYYKDFEDMKNAFGELLAKMPTNGIVVANTDFAGVKDVVDEWGLSIVQWQNTNVPELKVIGKFNVENAKVAKTVALSFFDDLKESKVDKSLSEFTGTWRRFEYKGITKNGMLIYDDYAHHPTAVEGTIKIAKEHFSDKKIIVLFHPHLYSRTKSFFDEFAKALSFADKVFLLPIYAAREVDTGITSSEKLAERVNECNGNAVYVQTFEEAKDVLKKYDEKYLLLTMGAGDVYKIADEITER